MCHIEPVVPIIHLSTLRTILPGHIVVLMASLLYHWNQCKNTAKYISCSPIYGKTTLQFSAKSLCFGLVKSPSNHPYTSPMASSPHPPETIPLVLRLPNFGCARNKPNRYRHIWEHHPLPPRLPQVRIARKTVLWIDFIKTIQSSST